MSRFVWSTGALFLVAFLAQQSGEYWLAQSGGSGWCCVTEGTACTAMSLNECGTNGGVVYDSDNATCNRACGVNLSACGNRMLDAGEACDDGNTQNNDGCSASCAVEDGWQCRAVSSVQSSVSSASSAPISSSVSSASSALQISAMGAEINIDVFPLPGKRKVLAVTTGPDGNMWYVAVNVVFGANPWPVLSETHVIGKETPGGVITEFPIPTRYHPDSLPIVYPSSIAAGPDGNLWFTEYNGNKIGRITLSGEITEFPLPVGSNNPHQIIAGPDGNLWFSFARAEPNLRRSGIGRITPSGEITEFLVPTVTSGNIVLGSILRNPVVGPDGNVWFVESHSKDSVSVHVEKIGRITMAGSITDFVLPAINVPILRSIPQNTADRIGGFKKAPIMVKKLIAGPDGNLWFDIDITSPGGIGDWTIMQYGVHVSPIGRITPAGAITIFEDVERMRKFPETIYRSNNITAGPDGNLWFLDTSRYAIGRITPSGTIATFPLPTRGRNLQNMIAGPDGNLWFAEYTFGQGSKIGRITPAGTITEFSIPPQEEDLALGLIVAGKDGGIWFYSISDDVSRSVRVTLKSNGTAP